MPAGSVEVSPESITPDSFMAGETAVEIPREAPGQPGRAQLAFQNNNPGNLRNTDGSWRTYSSPAEGYKDLQDTIRRHAWRGDTLEDYLGAYAPPSENDTETYIQNVEKALGKPRTTKLSALDREKLAQFQAKQESSSRVQMPASDSQIQSGAALTPDSFMSGEHTPHTLPSREAFEADHQAAVQNMRDAVHAQHPPAAGAAKPLYMAPGPAKGLAFPGNTDLTQLAPIDNGDGTWSTVNSTSFTDEKPGSPTYGKEVLVRGILNGKRAAMKQEYYRTGKHLGVFNDPESADAYAQRLHEDWQAGKIPGVQMRAGGPNAGTPKPGILDMLKMGAEVLPAAVRVGASIPLVPFSKVAQPEGVPEPTAEQWKANPIGAAQQAAGASRVIGGVTKGAADLAEGMTTPTNIALILGSSGLGMIPRIGAYLPRALSAGFGFSMLKSAWEQSPEVRDAIAKKDWPRAAEVITKLAGTVGMAALAGTHAARGTPGPSGPSESEVVPRGTEPPEVGSRVATAPRSVAAGEEAITPDSFMQQQAAPSAPETTPAAIRAEVPAAETAPGELNPDAFMRQQMVRTPAATVGNTPESQPVADMAAEPRPVGRDATVYTPRETKADVQYELANMPDLRTSFDTGYDQDLQPRETDRIGSRQRIEELKGTLNPEKLAESVNAGDGAPIVLPDGQVLTGNHRTVALRELYDAGHPRAQEYKAWLQENAPRFGLKPEDVAAIEQPVLVRRMTNPGDKADLVRFAEEANMSTTARMSDAEQAQMLAKRITGPVMEAFDPREDGTPNAEFVQALLRDLPAQERAAFMDSKGQLSQSGMRTVRNAVFAKAYPDVTAIERMAESTDSNVRNISNGMLAAAPKFARLQEAIAAGDRHSLGIERETTQAAETLNSLKDQGVTVPQWLSQENLFGRDPVVDRLVQSFAENRRSAKRIGEVLKVYTDLVDRLGSPKQEGLFGAEQPPNRAELIEAASEIIRQRNALAEETGKTGELFPEGAAPHSGETGAAGEPRTTEAGDVQNPVTRPSGERGSVDLSDLAESMRRRFPGIDPNEPEINYSGLGATKDKWIRNLSQLEEASPRGHEAAVRAGSSESQARVLVATATPKIEAALGKDGPSFQEFRQALIESRLRGLRARWQDFARQAQRQTPEGLKNSLDNGVLDLLKNIEGKRGLPQDLAQTAAALAEHEDWPALGHFLSQTFSDAAESVGSTLTPDEFARIADSEGFRRALPVYKQLLEQPIAESHARNEGIFSNALGPLETYYPLVPVTAADRVYATVGKRAPYRPPANIANRFATGLGEEYDTGMEAFADRMRAAIKTNNKAAMLKSLADEGLIQPLKPGQQAPDTIEYQGRQFHAEVVETAADRTVIKDGKITHVPAGKALVPSFLRRELAPILERGTAAEGEKRLMNLITKIQLLGPLDFAIHGSNLVGTLVANTPFIGDSLLGKAAGSIPFTKRIAALVKIAATDPTTPEAARDLQEMAKLGVLPPRFASQTYSKRFAEQTGAEFHRFSLGPALYGPSGLDARARLVMYRLAKDINPDVKPAELGKFVNQLGQYTKELQGEVERSVKRTGFAPFYTAGSTMLRNAVHAWTGTGPMPSDGLYRLAQQLSGGAAGVVGAWALTYRAYTGKWPWDDRRARLLQIPVNASDRRSPLGRALWGKGPETGYVNFGFFSPMVARGARAMGLTGAFDTNAAHGSAGQAAESAITGVINAVLHPFAGPAVRAAWTAATGTDLYVTGLRDDRGRASPQFMPETKKTAYGWPTVKARAAATAMTLNSFFGNAAVATGFGNGLRAADEKGNKALRMVIDLVAPQLVGRPQNPAARAGYLERQRKAAASGR